MYTKHFVCYLDILGFKNAILHPSSDDEINVIWKILKAFEEIRNKFSSSDMKQALNIHTKSSDRYIGLNIIPKMSMFSDSIIISFEVPQCRNDFLDLYYALFSIGEFAFNTILISGKLMRGGFTYGDLYHENDVCFGPALIEAVQLEENAIYPRISVASHILDYTCEKFPYSFLCNELNTNIKRRMTFEYIQREILSTDLTGATPIHYIDYLWRYLPMSEDIAVEIKEVVESHLDKDYNDHIMQKYIWVAECFNFILGSYTDFKIDSIKLKSEFAEKLKQTCKMPSYLLP